MDDLISPELVESTEEEAEACGPSPEDTASLPVVAAAPSTRLPRATNLLALGQAAEAAALCREELVLDPASTEAYALLAIAEEQAGNRDVAIEMYEELLRLDPDRPVEAEHLAALRCEAEELRAEEPSPEEQEERLRRMQPLALIIMAGAVVCLLAALTLMIVARHRAADTRQAYAVAMQTGYQYYQGGYYRDSMNLFAEAVRLFPRDAAARQWYAYADQQARATGTYAATAPPLINPAAQPFAPVPLGNGAPPAAGTLPPPPGGLTPPPTVRGSTRATDWGDVPALPPTEPTGGQPIIQPVPPPGGNQPPVQAPPVPTESAPPPPAEPQPMIKIERVDTPRRAGADSALQKADGLRAQGDGLAKQGQYGEALSAYQGALAAYEKAKAAQPERGSTIDSRIGSVQAKIRLCKQQSS
ncbi:MAG TPA: hypothetical protein VGM19_02560 [Armatimonadota bacterium]|jgi:tetratricopeptide (TPR) repeat protein